MGDVAAGGWDLTVDVAVVGCGAAGICAAIEARSHGAEVLVIDRFLGGGATARSGGVVYAGGGSEQQRASGYVDDAGEMFKYLSLEVGDVVAEATLRSFCEGSLKNIAWLESLGVPFPPSASAPVKTSYPLDECTLYFSGNELAHPYRDDARPAPRGHRIPGAGLTGRVFYRHLRQAMEAREITVRYRSRARRLITDADGRVRGLEVDSMPDAGSWARVHTILFHLASDGIMLSRTVGRFGQRMLSRLEAKLGCPWKVRTRRGVILCAGGFAFNAGMVARQAPHLASGTPIGTAGDDGGGIELGRAAGGAIGSMERGAAWRFINPPEAFTRGILVDARGERICNEELYGATLGERIGERAGGRAALVIDAAIARMALEQIRGQRGARFQKVTALVNLFLNRKRARTLAGLEVRCGMPPGTLSRAVDAYNATVLEGIPDRFGKAATLCQPIRTSPFYAIRCDLDSRLFMMPFLTLGGLRVNGISGRVLRPDGSPIIGLYAAGRNAVGVSSRSYVSGLSLADCVFSGRNAGRHAATAGNVP